LQLAVLSATFRVIATDLDGGYALVSGRLRGRLAGPARARRFDRITGSLLIGAGLWLAAARRG
jgi:threonine/homoserine/homoserine lactone efflux protein